VERLNQVDANLLGVVLNDVPDLEGSYYYGPGYYERGDGRATRWWNRWVEKMVAAVPRSGAKGTASGVARASGTTAGLPGLGGLPGARREGRRGASMSGRGTFLDSARPNDQIVVTVANSDIQEFARGWKILVEDGDKIRSGQAIASWRDRREIVAERSGRVRRVGRRTMIVPDRRDEYG
jgi:hypothetical protein